MEQYEFFDNSETVNAGTVHAQGCNTIEIYNVSPPGVTMYVMGLPIAPGFYYQRAGNNPGDRNYTKYNVSFSASTGTAVIIRKTYKL